jgi:3-oxoacyl-[acyl-carrier protein] reductase
MLLGLEKKVALVSGASRGLGRAVAEELSTEGCVLVIASRDAESIGEASSQIMARTGNKVVPVSADVSSLEGVEHMLEIAQDEFGRVDILVTNAGGPPAGNLETQGPEVWQQYMNQTLRSVVELCRGVVPGMRQRGWGRILNITSIAVKQPVDNLGLSNSLRAAVTGFARTLANEVAKDGITVNNLMPGYTRTDRLEDLASTLAANQDKRPEDIYEGWCSQIPMGRIGEPKEFAALAAFLASERASYITGTSIPVDGGWIRSLL